MTEIDHIAANNNPPTLTTKSRSMFRRFGCWFGLLAWIILLLFPCFAIALISQGEISVRLGDVPGQSLRIWLIQDATERGIGVARPMTRVLDENTVCLQTDTNFILWAGSGQPASSCECFFKQADTWISATLTQGTCNP